MGVRAVFQVLSARPRGLRILGWVLVAAGFALGFGPILWADEATQVYAVNESCTPSPPRCVAGWDQHGRHYTDEIGPLTYLHRRESQRVLTPGATNVLHVRGGHVVEASRRVLTVGLVIGALGILLSYDPQGRPRRGRSARRGTVPPGGVHHTVYFPTAPVSAEAERARREFEAMTPEQQQDWARAALRSRPRRTLTQSQVTRLVTVLMLALLGAAVLLATIPTVRWVTGTEVTATTAMTCGPASGEVGAPTACLITWTTGGQQHYADIGDELAIAPPGLPVPLRVRGDEIVRFPLGALFHAAMLAALAFLLPTLRRTARRALNLRPFNPYGHLPP